MIRYIIAFLAGGYTIPAIVAFNRVWKATRPCRWMTTADRVLTATRAAVTWPVAPVGYVRTSQLDELRRRDQGK